MVSQRAAPGIFSSRSFRQYYAGQTLSLIGDGLRTLAVPLLVYRLTGSALSTGVSYICEIAPFAVFGLIGGSLADRLDRRTLMIGTDAVRCAIMALFALLYARHALTIPMLYGGLVLLSICAAVFMGGQASSIPFLLGRDRGTQAVAALAAAENTSNLITPVAGGALFSIFGPFPALAANALTYLLSQLSLARIPTLGPHETHGVPSLRHVTQDVRLGFSVLLADRGLRAQTFFSFALNTIGFGAYAVLIPFLKGGFHATDAQVGIFLGISACGAVCGSLVAGKFASRWPFGYALCVAYAIDAVLFLPVILTKNMWIAGVFWAIGNACAQFEVAQIVGFRLRVIPEELVGRVFGVVRLIVLFGIAPGVIAFGTIADKWGAHRAMEISAFGYLVLAFAAIASPAIRQERR
ncbi:MAG TPA: MFS transporter [Candidatus Baltobacteraceae bacterium]|jgi:MFS family permease|nr:MFS transporter [Candidatus Baltobacteraceae bacterium]